MAIDLLALAMGGLSLYQSRVQISRHAAVTAANLSRVLEQYVTGVIGKVDVGLAAVAAEAEEEIADDGAMNRHRLQGRIEQEAALLPELSSIRVADARGVFVLGTGPVPAAEVAIAGPDFFTQLRQHREMKTCFSGPLIGRVTGSRLVILARRLNRPDGTFAGAVCATFPLEQFGRIFSSVDVGPRGTIALRDEHLGLVLHHPEPKQVRSTAVSDLLYRLVVSGKKEGTYRTRTPLDGVDRTFSFRKVAGLPFYINVGLARNDYLAPWRDELAHTAALIAFFCVVTIFSSLLLCREWRRKQAAEEALRVSEEHFYQLFMQNWDAVLLLEKESYAIVGANAAMVALFGYPDEELHRLPPLALVAPESGKDFLPLLEQAAPERESFLARTTCICRDQSRISVSCRAKVIRIRDKNVIYCSFRDISERIRAEREQRETQAKLINANKMASLGMLVSGIAHEINNPNQYISMNALILDGIWSDASDLLSRHCADEGVHLKGLPLAQAQGAVPRLLQAIVEGSRRIGLIVNNLRDFARDESGAAHSVFDINSVVEGAVQILSYQIHKGTDRFHTDLAADLPGVKGKAQQIEQVVINLLVNALQALTDKDQEVRVRTHLDRGEVLLSVIDQGRGMEPELLERITEPFFSTKLEEGGAGLGLSISATIMSEHGGALEFSSRPGSGTTATIRLRAYPAQAQQAPPQGV